MLSKALSGRGVSRGFGVRDFGCTWLAQTDRIRGCGKPRRRTWLAQTKLSEESGKPEESEVWRRRESDCYALLILKDVPHFLFLQIRTILSFARLNPRIAPTENPIDSHFMGELSEQHL
jgi:hypothetical protein